MMGVGLLITDKNNEKKGEDLEAIEVESETAKKNIIYAKLNGNRPTNEHLGMLSPLG